MRDAANQIKDGLQALADAIIAQALIHSHTQAAGGRPEPTTVRAWIDQFRQQRRRG